MKGMTSPPYDILKKDSATLVWVEAAADLEIARARVKELAAASNGEYVIFDQRTRKLVGTPPAPVR
jgi:hypothetical protein